MPDQGDPDITQMLHNIKSGDRDAAAELLPIVYNELRRLARARMSQTPQGQTLQPTALVHEAFLRLVGKKDPGWQGRAHFFGAAGKAMRNILVDQARRKASVKHGGDMKRVNMDDVTPVISPPTEDIVSLDEAVKRLEAEDPRKGQIVNLRYFAGLSLEETAAIMELSETTIKREWQFIKRWLYTELADKVAPDEA